MFVVEIFLVCESLILFDAFKLDPEVLNRFIFGDQVNLNVFVTANLGVLSSYFLFSHAQSLSCPKVLSSLDVSVASPCEFLPFNQAVPSVASIELLLRLPFSKILILRAPSKFLTIFNRFLFLKFTICGHLYLSTIVFHQ